MNALRRTLRLVCCTLIASVSACASKPPPPAIAEINLIVAPDVNPDGSGRPSPVILRMYELKSLAGFDAANFFSLLDRDKEVLGADLVAREELPLKPGEKREIKRTLQGETRYLGVTAAFRELERARWRATTAVPPNKTTPVEIRLDRNDVSIRAR